MEFRRFLFRSSDLKDLLIGQTTSAVPKGLKKSDTVTEEMLVELGRAVWWKLAVVEDNTQTALEAIKAQYDDAIKQINAKYEDRVEKLQRGDELAPGVQIGRAHV